MEPCFEKKRRSELRSYHVSIPMARYPLTVRGREGEKKRSTRKKDAEKV